MSNNYSEQIFQSIDKIISQRLNEVSFDKTEICTIISQDSNYTGKYLVSNEAGLKYDAYILDENYQYYEDQKVYVTIPQGDYSFRKVIIGSYYGDEIPKNLYTNPFDNLVINSQYHWINTDNQLSALAYKNNQIDQKSFVSNELTFYYSGLGQFNYIGLDFSATTDFGGTTGEFQIIIDLLDRKKNSLLTSAELGLLTFSSKQLYGNPYYLNNTLKFQHLFNFPVGNFSDLTLVKHVKITLVTKGNFNYNNTDVQSVILNDLTIYFGFDSSENIMSNSNIVLDLDIPDGTKESSKDYTYSTDVKTMSIEWVNTDTKAIYNETTNMQYPEAKKYNIYWLQYSESIGYKKLLETIKPDILSCYPKDKEITEEEYNNALKAKFKNSFNESIDIYDKVLYDKYSSFYADTYSIFANNIEQAFIDLEESGTYWKTVKKSDAYNSSAYTYSLQPAPTWKNEQIKVIIKSVDGDDYLSSKSLEFINTNFRQETGSNQGKADTLKLTLAEGDDGIYNSYGIDNKLLSTQNETHKITVSFIDESLEKMWDNSVQKVIWKIPKHASMVAVPQVKQENKDGSFEFVDDNRWDKIADPNFYIYTNTATDDAKTVNFNISPQFGHNKTNNSIICEIIRYKSAILDIIDDTYNGSIKLEFGTQGTSGSAYAFNIYPNTSDGLLIDGSNKITFRATLENNQGVTIPFEGANVQWYFLYGDQELKPENLATGNTYELTKDFMVFEGKNSYYFILVAELTGWVDTTGNAINLKAYYPIPHTAKQGYYISGASRVIYTYQGTTPNYDQSPYKLYDQYHNEVPVSRWEVRFPDWANKKYYNADGSKNGYWNNFPTLKILNEENIDIGLQPLPNIQSNVLACNITAYKDDGEATSILWAQPLLIMRNNYAFDVLNAWDGNLIIDTEGNKILSQLIGAGTKNENNQFTGVLMGAVGKYGAASTGLYGFQNGDLRYKLDEHGNFYVGTGDNNKIDFTNSTLDIHAKNFKLQIEDSENKNQLYFSNIANSNNAWLQFKDKIYFNADGTATIGGWTITNNKFYSGDPDSNRGIALKTQGTYALAVGSNSHDNYTNAPFRVTHEGKLFATGADIQGKLNINSESILNGTEVSKINSTTITSTPDSIALKAFEQKTTINGVEKTLQAHLQLNADNIKAKVSKTIDKDNQEDMSWNLTSSSFIVKANGTQVMKVTKDGLTITGNGTFSGQLSAATGTFKGELSAATGTFKGSINVNEKKFYVDSSGNVTISGDLTVDGTGTIGGCTINSSGQLIIPSGQVNGNFYANGLYIREKVGNEWKYYAKISTGGQLEFSNNTGYFTMGTKGSFHPYVSGLNISRAGGIKIINATKITDDPSIYYAYLYLGSDNNGNVTINSHKNFTLYAEEVGANMSFSNITPSTTSTKEKEAGYIAIRNGLTADYHNKTNGSIFIYAVNNITLHARGENTTSGGGVYAGRFGGNNYLIYTEEGFYSSKNLKENIHLFEQNDYDKALNILEKMNVYNYKYKYNVLNNANRYGFLIDEVEQLEMQQQTHFFDFTHKTGMIDDQNCLHTNPDEFKNNWAAIDIANYDNATLSKYLLTVCKALQQKIQLLTQEIKEIKQNEI